MKERVPDYYRDFSCIGSKCKDNCCIGWEIDIDDYSMDQYDQLSGKFAEKLQNGIIKGNPSVFKMKENGRCVFLNEKNLCEIYIHLGESALCEICTQHPRFHNCYGNFIESGLGIACETAAKLALERENPIVFKEYPIETEQKTEDSIIAWFFRVRNNLINIIQNRFHSIEHRIKNLLSYGIYIQQLLNQKNDTIDDIIIAENIETDESIFEKMRETHSMELWLDIYLQLDIMSASWKKLLENADPLKSCFKKMNDIFYEQLLVYFMFRHLMNASEDFNIMDRIKFCVLSCLIIHCVSDSCYASANHIQEIDAARLYSKEIEYSDENIDSILEELLFS